MAYVDWSAGIDSVSGALAKPAKTGHHRCNKMLLGTHRIAETTTEGCNRVYIRKKVKRKTQPSANEMAARNRFAAVRAAVKARKTNLTTLSTDQAAFIAQKDQAGGKKTWNAYLWYVCGQEYDAQH